MKHILCALLMATLSLTAQDWEKASDFMGLRSHCSHFPLIGTNDGLVERISQGYNDWRHLGMQGHTINAVLPISNGKADTILVGTPSGLYYTPDYGTTWNKADLPELKCNKIVTMQSRSIRFLALTESGVYSSWTGVNWKLYALAGKDVQSYEVGGHFNDIFGFVCSDDYYYTEDYGSTFKAAGLQLPKSEHLLDLNIYSTNVGEYKLWVNFASNKGVYVIRMDSLYFSQQAQWEARYKTPESIDIRWYSSNGGNYTLATNQGIYYSQDSAKTFSNNNQIKANITNGEYRKQTYNSAAFTLYTTLDHGVFQNNTPIGFSNIKDIEIAPDGSLFIGTYGFGVFQSTDDGKTWASKNKGLGNLEITDLAFTKKGDLYAATRSGAYLSNDNGKNWVSTKPEQIGLFCLLTDGYPNDGLMHFASGKNTFYWLGSNFNWNGGANVGIDNLSDEIYSIYYERTKEKYWAGGKYGLWKSNTDYVSWQRNSAFPSYSIYDFDADSQKRLLALTKAYIYYSEDDGASWEKLANIPKRDLKQLVIDKDDHYYVATDGGVYYSTDRGQSWLEMNDGFLNLPYQVMIDCIAIDKKGHLWAGSTVSGLYRSKAPVTASTHLSEINSPAFSVSYNKASQSVILHQKQSFTPGTLKLYTTEGKMIYQARTNSNSLNIPLLNGIYIAHFKSGNDSYAQSFVVK